MCLCVCVERFEHTACSSFRPHNDLTVVVGYINNIERLVVVMSVYVQLYFVYNFIFHVLLLVFGGNFFVVRCTLFVLVFVCNTYWLLLCLWA